MIKGLPKQTLKPFSAQEENLISWNGILKELQKN